MNEDRVDEVLPEQADCEQPKQSGEALEPDMALTVRVFVHDKKMIVGVEADHAKKGLEEKLERMALQFSSALSFGIRHFGKEIKALINAD